MIIKMTGTNDLFVEYTHALSKKEFFKWCETRDMFTEFQSVYTNKRMNSYLDYTIL
jgi:hypothetical protein